MSDSRDPPRWTEEPSELGALFSAAQRDGATPEQLDALSARLEPALAAPPTVALSPLLKLVIGASLGALGLAGALFAVQRAHRNVGAGRAPLVVTSAPSAVVSAPEPPARASREPAVPSAAAPSPLRTPATASSSAPAVGESEAKLLERARRELGASPALALTLANEHARRFPRGMLSQEREVIAIAALRRLGRIAEAEARAARFDRSYPNSAHQRTVDDHAR